MIDRVVYDSPHLRNSSKIVQGLGDHL
ncbi:hypothetical protein Esi_0040_0128 [Ectocarpus siliculosus]|uniref:Uncharacterized protein n=1 Tax=Ectocarpus siliculosus TaxID=2880 RepID=D7G0F4_ECTSI|nr:hypothetical protein Esi_0040_0128 [Ectocarpus siliculosus]|eukprot:CBJ26681.1 hypothetical protein Esi_0040_0128 [Ectocarpus siliculosus]